jgi:hypothetical protein
MMPKITPQDGDPLHGTTVPRGSDSYIITADDAFSWTVIDTDDYIQHGVVYGEWASYDDQLQFAKIFLVKRFGHDVQDSRLHAQNERNDRNDW